MVITTASKQALMGMVDDAPDPTLVALIVLDTVAGLEIPTLDDRVLAAANQKLTIGAESHCPNAPLIAVAGIAQTLFGLSSLDIPETNGDIVATASQGFAVGAEGDRPDPGCVPLEHMQAFTGFGIPEADVVVEVAGGDRFAIGAIDNGPEPVGVTGEGFEAFTRLGIPEFEDLIVVACDDRAIIGAEGKAANTGDMALADGVAGAASQVPEAHQGAKTGAGEFLAVGAKGQGFDFHGVACQGFLAGANGDF